MKLTPQDVLHFWFDELSEKDWFAGGKELDEKIIGRFGQHMPAARQGEFYIWRTTTQGRLAEIIMLDQFSRNIYRNKPEAFASDAMALTLSQELIGHNLDKELTARQLPFAYMPFMHSESRVIHYVAMKLFGVIGGQSLDYEQQHRDIIERFGRFPHRNAILGRESTSEEIEFMKTHKGF